MAATYTDNGGSVNGSNKVFTYSFPVLQTEDIKVALNGVTQATNRYTPSLDPTNITFHNTNGVDSTVQEADGAPKSGVTVRVYRETTVGKASGDEDPKAVFAAGSSIRAGDLNANIEQALFGIHEQQEKIIQTEDLADDAVTSAKLDTNIDIAGTLDVTGATTLDSTLNVTGTTTATTINASGAVGIDGDFDVNTNKFTVAASSGNTTVAGTLAAGATTVTGNIAVSGTVDGRDVATDGSKLDGIEAGATADQTDAQIRAAVEAATDSNVFTDADHSKLNAIEANATADQSNAEIRAAVEAATDSNVFTDADHSKLNAIEASADVTDATNVNAAGAVMNSDLATKGTIVVGDGSGDPTILSVGTNNHVLVADSNEASGVKWATVPAGSGLSNVVEDTTPQLGGALDVQAQEINTSTTNGNIKLTPNGTGVVEVKGNTNPGTIQLNCENNSHGVKLKGPAHSAAASYTLTLPNDDGDANEVLKTDGSGNLDWTAITTDLVGDTSPQLGGDLDVNTNSLTSTSNGDVNVNPHGTGAFTVSTAVGGTNSFGGGGDTYFAGNSTNVGMEWDYSENALIFRDGTNASFGTGEDLEIRHDSGNTINEIKSTNGKIVVSTTANDDDIEITPNGTGDVVIDGLKYPQADGSAGQFLKTNGSGQLSWDTVAGTITALNNQAANRLTTIGSTTTQLDGEANLTFDGSTLAVTGNQTVSTTLAATGQITGRGFECPATVTANWSIAAANNAFFPGPMTVDSGVTVTVPANRTLTIV